MSFVFFLGGKKSGIRVKGFFFLGVQVRSLRGASVGNGSHGHHRNQQGFQVGC